MKLRNKKTGGLATFEVHDDYLTLKTDSGWHDYDSLAELNEEWEDYEDELFYVISAEHKSGYQCVLKEDYPEICEVAKELGIGFETEKEARRAVEKLKACKRLKDKGFKLNGWTIDDGLRVSICTNLDSDGIYDKDRKETKKDLDICFGGEE